MGKCIWKASYVPVLSKCELLLPPCHINIAVTVILDFACLWLEVKSMRTESSGSKNSSLYPDIHFLRCKVKSSLSLFLNWRPASAQQWSPILMGLFCIFVSVKEPEQSTERPCTSCPVSFTPSLEVGRRGELAFIESGPCSRHFTYVLGLIFFSLKFICWNPLVPQNVAMCGDRVCRKIIKLQWGH